MYRVTWTTERTTHSQNVPSIEQAVYLKAAILRSDSTATVTIEPA